MLRLFGSTRLLAFAALSTAAFAQGTKVYEPAGPVQEGTCNLGSTANLCIPVDGTHTVVVFDGIGGSGPANPGDPCQRNDDDTTLAINLPFNFDMFGSPQNQVFINNNGNVSFGAGFDTFTSTGFPVNGFPMIAPFWADVDTRNSLSGVVYYKIESNRLTVTWDHVGYFSSQADKLCTFQLIMSDGTDPLVGIGQNVCFCYGDMQWTTGSASGGVGGFGGTPATVGINAGDGVNFFQIGRFDHEGNDYDGPGGAADGVSLLDNSRQCLRARGRSARFTLRGRGEVTASRAAERRHWSLRAREEIESTGSRIHVATLRVVRACDFFTGSQRRAEISATQLAPISTSTGASSSSRVRTRTSSKPTSRSTSTISGIDHSRQRYTNASGKLATTSLFRTTRKDSAFTTRAVRGSALRCSKHQRISTPSARTRRRSRAPTRQADSPPYVSSATIPPGASRERALRAQSRNSARTPSSPIEKFPAWTTSQGPSTRISDERTSWT